MSGVGQQLTEARQARGLTLEQAERDTRIIRRYLAALEADDLGAFPAEVYARGFLRTYANYLGLNPSELLTQVPRRGETDASLPAAEPERSRGARASRPRPALPRLPAASSLPALPRLPGFSPLRAWAAGVVLLLGASYGVARLAGDGATGGLPDRSRLTPAPSRASGPTAPPTAGAPAVAGRMPDLRGVDLASAVAQLGQLGVTPVIIQAPSAEVAVGLVIRQSPAPNERIGARTVTLIVSKG